MRHLFNHALSGCKPLLSIEYSFSDSNIFINPQVSWTNSLGTYISLCQLKVPIKFFGTVWGLYGVRYRLYKYYAVYLRIESKFFTTAQTSSKTESEGSHKRF